MFLPFHGNFICNNPCPGDLNNDLRLMLRLYFNIVKTSCYVNKKAPQQMLCSKRIFLLPNRCFDIIFIKESDYIDNSIEGGTDG